MADSKWEHLPTSPYFIIKPVMIGCKLSIFCVRGMLSLKTNKNLPENRPLVGLEWSFQIFR